MSRTLPVLVAGAGIGGLAAALALARAGLPVTLLERREAPAETGAGLQLGPNATRELARLGLGEAVAAAGHVPRAAVIRDGRTGARLFRMTLGEAAARRWGAPWVQIHRADLQALLLAAALRAGATLRGGAEVAEVAEEGAAVAAILASGEHVAGRALVGADGIASTLRARLLGPGRAGFTGQAAWRATVPVAGLPPGLVAPDATVWAGPGRHLVTYPVRGGALANIVAVFETPGWTSEDWTMPGDPAALRAAFAGWHDAVTGLLARVTGCGLWALRAALPLPHWGRGRVTLLGDAAHPMLPSLAQGAAMAIEDAAVLARCLAALPVPEALRRYEALRRPRTARVQAASARNARLFHAAGPGRLAAFAPLALASRLAPSAAPLALSWLYGHDASASAP